MTKKLLISFLLLQVLSFSSILVAQNFTLKIQSRSPGELNLDPVTSQTWQISTGLRVNPLGKPVYLLADTTGAGVTYAWVLTTKPNGSATLLDSSGTMGNSFTPDVTGLYTVSVTVGSRTLTKDIFISTFRGNSLTQDCAPCHQGETDKYDEWQASGHATMYKRGITGLLGVENGQGTYGDYCSKCHTTSWNPDAANGNFKYLSIQTGWDTTWYKPAELVDGRITIPEGDSTRWVNLVTNFPTVEKVANIGCESCHGPANDHAMTGDPTKVDVSIEGGACLQCHDAPPQYNTGTQWKASAHSTLHLSGEATARTTCFPCHRGAAFVKFAKNPTNPGYDLAEDDIHTISCATCHEPHTLELRLTTLDTLANGYVPESDPDVVGGNGYLCMNCHHARENSVTRVNSQQVRFRDRFYPHYSPQADMFLGANAYEYDLDITGIGTHQFIENACVTCHMSPDPEEQFPVQNHVMTMRDEEGNERVEVCQPCHGNITSFNEVMAKSDYDGDGSVEGTQTEIIGLLDQLRAILPKDTSGEPVTMAIDSMLVKNDPNYPRNLPAIYNYYFVKNDWSEGVHNSAYAVALLQASLSRVTGVQVTDDLQPDKYSLEQNYPNPFNPATQIEFSIPEETFVSLVIYDVTGHEVATLQRGRLKSGNYSVNWNAGGFASGIYYYKLETNNYSVTKKMILLK